MAITGKSKTEANYRANMLDSSSSLKEFSMDRKKYYKKYVLGDTKDEDEKENQAATMGRIVETLLLEPHEFDGRFYLSSCYSVPTGLMLTFVEALYRIGKECMDDKGVMKKSFTEISREAYVEAGWKITFEAVLSKFIGSDAEIYYREICTVRSQRLTVISSNEVSFGERIADNLKQNFVTKEIIGLLDSMRYKICNQFQLEGYEIDGIKLKSMFDKIIVDHEKKWITIYDLKCTWNVENFYEEYYLYRRSYIQAYLYYTAIKQLTENEEHDWFGYKVHYPTFIVCDSTNYYNPLLYATTEKEMGKAYNGFIYKGRTYPGVKEIIQDLLWAIENNIWNMGRKAHENDGIIDMDEL